MQSRSRLELTGTAVVFDFGVNVFVGVVERCGDDATLSSEDLERKE